MRKSPRGKLAALAACAALALSAAVPAGGIADRGGVPHNTNPCPAKGHGHGPKRAAPNSHGRKCGFNRPTTDPVTTPGDDGTDGGTTDDGTTDGGTV